MLFSGGELVLEMLSIYFQDSKCPLERQSQAIIAGKIHVAAQAVLTALTENSCFGFSHQNQTKAVNSIIKHYVNLSSCSQIIFSWKIVLK